MLFTFPCTYVGRPRVCVCVLGDLGEDECGLWRSRKGEGGRKCWICFRNLHKSSGCKRGALPALKGRPAAHGGVERKDQVATFWSGQ